MTHLSTRGRDALDRHYANIAQVNNTANVHRQFNIDPTVEQRLEDLQTESVEFLNAINIYGVRDLKGQTIGMGANNFVGSRTSAANLPRKPKYVGRMQDKAFELFDTEFDTMLPWALIDAWSKFPDFSVRYSRAVATAIGLTRITVGWHGESAAAQTNLVANPNGEDLNIGWLHKLRLERPDHVMGRVLAGDGTATGAAAPILVGNGQAYQNVDALAYDLISGMPSWARTSTEHVVMVSADLVDEKYFPMVNRALSPTIDGSKATSDEQVGTIIKSQKQIGGRPAWIVPNFPEGTLFISPPKNLSIYWQEGSRRRYIKDEPENKRGLVDYNSVNEGYVIEDDDFAVMAENITFEAADPGGP